MKILLLLSLFTLVGNLYSYRVQPLTPAQQACEGKEKHASCSVGPYNGLCFDIDGTLECQL